MLAFDADFPYLVTLRIYAFVEGNLTEGSEAIVTIPFDFPVFLVVGIFHELPSPTRIASVVTEHRVMKAIPVVAPLTIILRTVR